MKKLMILAVSLALVAGLYISYTMMRETAPVANAKGKNTYMGNLYVAGMGGHFAVADVTIDPNNTDHPIKINELGMMSIGGKTHPTHDARIDSNDRNIMYWSTYKYDNWKDKSKETGFLHVGKSNLKTGEVLADVAIPKPDRAGWTGANYCGSGQSDKYYMPVSMSDEGYIDVIDKKTMKVKHRIFFDTLGYKAGEYTFAHGINSPDMKTFLLSLNLTPSGHTKWTGNTQLILLDLKALENGKIKKIAEAQITGKPKDASGGTITFRQYFSEDGKYFFQSGADRGYLIDAKTLKVLDEITPLPGENHDIIPTPDAKYAVMTLREKIEDEEGKQIVDGTLLLYDVEARKVVGKSVSVCYACHKDVGAGKAVLCGLDANWKM